MMAQQLVPLFSRSFEACSELHLRHNNDSQEEDIIYLPHDSKNHGQDHLSRDGSPTHWQSWRRKHSSCDQSSEGEQFQ